METSDNSSNYSGSSRNTPEVKSSGLYKTLVIVFIAIVVLISIPIVVNKLKVEKISKTNKVTSQTESVYKSTTITSIPDTYTEYHLLKKGEVIRVNVPSGYSYTLSGGGKKYYCQYQNATKPEILGDGKYHDSGKHIAYFDLFYYDEEITVVCEFKKIQY